MKSFLVCAAVLALFAGSAQAQTMLDQEERLIEIHSLLIALPPGNAPGAYRPGELSLGVELVGIPNINGQTGGKTQITASDETNVYPRLRAAVGLPAWHGFRAFAGLAYIPPITIRDITSNLGALEGGLSKEVARSLTVGVRAQLVLASSKAPVTDLSRQTRDTLDNFIGGGDLSAGYEFDFGWFSATPFAGAGLSYVAGNFTVTSDQNLPPELAPQRGKLTSRTVNPSLDGGIRLFAGHGFKGFEGIFEVTGYPGVMVHPSFRIAWVPKLF
jgi:opacity protein-like surface antigen